MLPQNDSVLAKPKRAFLFPGQGSQRVGMGRDLCPHPAARAVFQELDESLGAPLTRVMWEGPEEELTRTINAQPAIMAVSLACLKAMEEALGPQGMPQADFMAGHSLGEYTALVAAGVLSLSDAIHLVRERGRLMQEASERLPGAMAAVLGLDEGTLEGICRETGAMISNINAQEQLVLAGDRVTLAKAMELAALRGAKRVLPLPVSGAFHTPLMEPAAAGMAVALARVPFQDPQVPVIANCSGRPLTSATSIQEELRRQLCSCVQWRRSINYLLDAGVTAFYEIGPGRVLTNLLKGMGDQVRAVSVNSLATIQEMAGERGT